MPCVKSVACPSARRKHATLKAQPMGPRMGRLNLQAQSSILSDTEARRRAGAREEDPARTVVFTFHLPLPGHTLSPLRYTPPPSALMGVVALPPPSHHISPVEAIFSMYSWDGTEPLSSRFTYHYQVTPSLPLRYTPPPSVLMFFDVQLGWH
jgi:hypothetical protein